MNLLATGFLFAFAAAVVAPAAAQDQDGPTEAAVEDPDLAELRELLEGARRAQAARDHSSAGERIRDAVDRALLRIGDREDAPATLLLEELARFAHDAGKLRSAERARRAVLEIRLRTLSEADRDLQTARGNLAVTLAMLGDLRSAKALLEIVHEVFSRTLPDDDQDLQVARQQLAALMADSGDLHGARDLEEKTLEVLARTLPAEHENLQIARLNLAGTLYQLGDLQGARTLLEGVVAVFSRTLPDEHAYLQSAKFNLAATVSDLGDLQSARSLFEAVLDVRSRTLPGDHPDVQRARMNLASTIYSLGDVQGARLLEEAVLEAFTATLPDDHPHLLAARQNLAVTLSSLGDLEGARMLHDAVLEVRSRTLPDDHPELQLARTNVAATMNRLGDSTGARALQEKVLEVYERSLPDEHPELQAARINLAVTASLLGDFQRARMLDEKALAVFARTLPDEHPDLQAVRRNLADVIARQSVRERSRPGEGEDEARTSTDEARERCAQLAQDWCRASTSAARQALLTSSSREAEERCADLSEMLDRSLSFARGYGVFDPLPALERASFVFGETMRGAALASAELMRRAANSPRYRELREALRRRSDDVAVLAQEGTTSEEFRRALAARETVERELVALARDEGGTPAGLDFDLLALAAGLQEDEVVVGFRRYTLWNVHASEEVDAAGQRAIRGTTVASLCAHVLRNSGTEVDGAPGSAVSSRVELGPVALVEAAVHSWREGLGVGSGARGFSVDVTPSDARASASRGRELRRLVFDPLLPALEGARHVILAFDDVLHLVPLDALPLDDPEVAHGEAELVGERWRIETRVTLAELFERRRARPTAHASADELLVVGGVDYGAPSRSDVAEPSPSGSTSPADVQAAVAKPPGDDAPSLGAHSRRADRRGSLRDGAWSNGFSVLTGTGPEAHGVAREFRTRFGQGAPVTLLERSEPTRERLLETAPRARWLHVATHGWFAPESIASWDDPQPADGSGGSGLVLRASSEEQVRGMSPMLLCGLALAGANHPENALGRVPGLVTAEEIAALDLSSCELAVLSACDTNVGERRAGQGVASLQKALQMAGARSVITSLWKVPDEATKELMLDFYRRLWVEKKPKWQSLWEAKMKMRAAVDENGAPLYTTRDWAAWVLTGDPE